MADDQVADQAYDEAIPVETDDEVSTPGTSEAGTPKPPPAAGATKRGRLKQCVRSKVFDGFRWYFDVFRLFFA